MNGYKDWALNIPKARPSSDSQQRAKDALSKRYQVSLPYVPGLSEELQRIFKAHDTPTYHKPINSLRSQLVRPKDPSAKEKQCGVIYEVTCSTCHQQYVGETARPLGTRFKEHLTQPSSAVLEHTKRTGHQFSMDDVKIITREDHFTRRKIKEALAIHKKTPVLNRDKGEEVAPILLQLLSRGNSQLGHMAASTQK